MDNEIVIQLAKFNDKTTTNNSNWSNNTNESITINEGDQILVSKAFIDTRDLTSANITIEKDIELELEYHFYWINDSNPGTNSKGFSSSVGTKESWIVPLDPRDYSDPNKTHSSDPSVLYPDGFKEINNDTPYLPPDYTVQITSQDTKNIEFNTKICLPNGWSGTAPNVLPTSNQNVMYADGRPYLMCYTDNSPYTQTWKYTLKAGSYSPDSLASLLTLNMASVKKDTEKSMEDNQSNEWFNSGQPFVASTTAYPPIWSMSNIDYTNPDPSTDDPVVSIINSNPYIQIDKSRGSVLASDWYIGSTGSVGYTGQPNGYLLPTIPEETAGAPPKKSLCFKNFISDSPTPNPSVNLPAITNPTITSDNMIPGLYYKIDTLGDTNWIKSGDTNPVPAVGDEFLCIFTGTIPDPIIPTSQMVNGKTYTIQSLGNSWNGEYDTNWLGISSSLTTPTVGEQFVCEDNTSVQLAFGVESQIDTINTFTFTLSYGYDLSTIGGPFLPSYSKTLKNIYDSVKRTDWVIIKGISPNFIGRNTNGIDYTQFMGASQTVIPFIETQYISRIDMSAYVPVALKGLTDLNAVSIGMRLEVTTVGSIDWTLLGVEDITTPFTFTVSELPTTPYTDNSIPFVASVLPNEIAVIRNNYTLPLQPFKPTGALSSNVINKEFSAIVLSTGTVEQTITHGTCNEIFSPDTPNFYIYPLTLQSKCNSVSYLFNESMIRIESFFGGPQFTYGFPLVGSTEIELAFNDDTNRFQWNYTHSPIQQGSAPGTTPVTTTGVTAYSEVVGMVNSFVPNPNILTDTTQPPYNTSMCKLTAQSGIIFKKMEPASFWQDILGFSKDLIATDEELGLTTDGTLKPITPADKERFTLERFNSITTTGLLTSAMNFTTLDDFPNAQESYVAGLRANTNGFNNVVGPVQLAYSPVVNQWSSNENISDFYREFSEKYKITGLPKDGSFPTTASLNSIYYQALDETKYINSIAPPLLIEDKYGHYLVSIDGYGSSSGLINEKQKILSKAIISNYYVNENSFVSLTFPDSQVYTHVGEPLQLNNFNISILNPETMQQIEGLGENSCVYIQINKQYSKEMLSQV